MFFFVCLFPVIQMMTKTIGSMQTLELLLLMPTFCDSLNPSFYEVNLLELFSSSKFQINQTKKTLEFCNGST